MSLAYKSAPGEAPDPDAAHRCIRWALQDEGMGKTPKEMVDAILDSFRGVESELVMLFCSPQFHIAEIAAIAGQAAPPDFANVIVALENFVSRAVENRWMWTGALGLVHGFGFAADKHLIEDTRRV